MCFIYFFCVWNDLNLWQLLSVVNITNNYLFFKCKDLKQIYIMDNFSFKKNVVLINCGKVQ